MTRRAHVPKAALPAGAAHSACIGQPKGFLCGKTQSEIDSVAFGGKGKAFHHHFAGLFINVNVCACDTPITHTSLCHARYVCGHFAFGSVLRQLRVMSMAAAMRSSALATSRRNVALIWIHTSSTSRFRIHRCDSTPASSTSAHAVSVPSIVTRE